MFIALRLGWVGIHNQIDFAAQVVHHRQFLRQHQENIGRAERVAFCRLLQAVGDVFEMVNALVAEIADQSAGKAGQFGNFGRFEAGVELLDNVQRVAFMRFGELVVAVDFGGAAGNFEVGVARQADEGIAPEAFAAHHGFEQVGKRAVGEFQVKRQRRVQICQQLLDEGDAVIALRGLGLVFLFGHHGWCSFMSGVQAAFS